MFICEASIQGVLRVLQHQGPQFLGARNFGKQIFCYMQFVKSTVLQQKY